MLETSLRQVLASVVPHVYPDAAPAPHPPYVVYQQVGGQVINPLADLPDLYNARVQVAVWAGTRMEASAASRRIEEAMRKATVFQAQPLGALATDHDPETDLYGARQDFSVWFR